MADESIPTPTLESDSVPTRIYWACTRDGAPWPVPLAAAQRAALRGHDRITVPELFLRPVVAPSDIGLTLADAAREHLDDVPPFDASDESNQLDAARKRIKRACDAGTIRCEMRDGRLRIDPASFAAWRLRYREQTARD